MKPQRSVVRPGQCLLGRYYIEKLLGEGGMGQVFLCHDTVRQGRYALKVIHPHLAPLEEVRRRFFQELKVTERLTHSGIVRTYNLEHHPLLFFIMEYVEGETMEDILQQAAEERRKPPVSLLQTARLLKELCGILTYAHAQGVIHRDIKPPNIMVTQDGHVKLMDFGIAKLLDSPQVKHTGFQGTVYYMAPEQLKGGAPVTPAADVFSLGILAYQLLTGEMPIGAVAPPSFYNAMLTQTVDSVVLQAIAQEPQHRYATPHSFWTALAESLEPMLSDTSTMLHSNSSQLPYPPQFGESADDLMEPLHAMPPHPTLESAMTISALEEKARNANATDVEVPTANVGDIHVGNNLDFHNADLSSEPTHTEIPSTAKTSFSRNHDSADNLPEQLDEYPVIGRVSKQVREDSRSARIDSSDGITNVEVPQARPSRTDVELPQTSEMGFAFPSLDKLEAIPDAQSKQTAQHPTVKRGGDETAVEMATVQTYRTSGPIHTNRSTKTGPSPERNTLASSKPRPLHHTLDPSLFSNMEDELIALEKAGPSPALHSSFFSDSASPHPKSSFQKDDGFETVEKTSNVPSSKYTATTLPEPPPLLESKYLYSRQDEPLLQFVRIPEGSFLMGSVTDDPLHCENELPQRHVHLDAFWIARTTITNRVWKTFVEESGYSSDEEDYLQHWDKGAPPEAILEHPVVYVSLNDVKRFCAFYGLLLPSEAQWERAARGDHGFSWPWGNNSPSSELCNFFDSELDTTTPVAAYPKGVSPYGLFDCSGNVWEWCSDEWTQDWLKQMGESPHNPIADGSSSRQARRRSKRIQYSIRGGCYLYRAGGVRCSFRYKSATRAPFIGARVIMPER